MIPAFVFRWLKESSSGAIRAAAEPNVRTQDGPKEYYFCRSCEQRFGKWEKRVAEAIFSPLHDEQKVPPHSYPHQAWLHRFAVSLSWRVLLHSRQKNGLMDLSPQLREAADGAFEQWRPYLLGRVSNTRPYDQHLLPLGLIDRVVEPIASPFFNRYATRTIDYDLPNTDDSLMVFSKLGKLAFFGFITNCRDREWNGTRIAPRNGVFLPTSNFVVPAGVLVYLSSKADDAAASLANLSSRQTEKIKRALEKNPVSAESIRAYERDVALFGNDARLVTNPPD